MDILKLDEISTSPDLQPRKEMDLVIITEYAADMKEGANFPSLKIKHDGEKYWLWDGYHRLAAAKMAEIDELPADIESGTFRDAILASVGANATHGFRRENRDKRKAVITLLEDEEWGQWSTRTIANICKVSHDTVWRIQKSILSESDSMKKFIHPKTGQPTTMDTSNIGKPQPKNEPPQPAFNNIQPAPLQNPSGDIIICPTCEEYYDKVKFNYGCPYCYKRNRDLSGWVEDLPKQMEDAAQPPPYHEPVLSDSEYERQQQVLEGQTVTANKSIDKGLIEWAKREGKYMAIDRGSIWGNPFIVNEDGTREEVIKKYQWYYSQKNSLWDKIKLLSGKVLGCWCFPEDCHGEFLINVLNSCYIGENKVIKIDDN